MNQESIQTNASLDILSLLEQEEMAIAGEAVLSVVTPIADTVEAVSILAKEEIPSIATTPLIRLRRAKNFIAPKVQFLTYYLMVSTVVFFVLLGATNWSAYSTILSAYVNPGELKSSGNDILSMLDKSKVMVYANDSGDSVNKEEQEALIKKKLEESKAGLREDRFSPRKLIPSEAKIDIDLDIAPYDNRIIIPKIGKNVPLVDVGLDSGFDFDHIENIFMKELEKGIVRYPGTARPGENGNAFIFGHSSNYPWMKGEYNSVFALLDELSFGDEIIVYYNQKKYTYIIREKKVIKPGNVKILDRDPDKKELSLMTCWPVGTTLNRLIVFAELQK